MSTGEEIAEEKEWRKLCTALILEAIVCGLKGIGKKYSYTAAKTIAKLCENDSEMLQI